MPMTGGKADLLAVALPPKAAAAAIWSAWESNKAVLPLDPTAPAPERRSLLKALRPTHLLDAGGKHHLALGRPTHPDVAAVVATSGTTGVPKGVELTWEGLRASALAVSLALDVSANDHWLCCLPVHRVAGLAILARAKITGVRLILHDRFDPAAVTAVAHNSDATLVSLVPTTLKRLLDNEAPLHRFRQVLVGGSPISTRLLERAAANEVPLVTTYGMTETWGGCVHDGHPLTGVELKLAKKDEIWIRGPVVMRGYRRHSADTAAILSPEGWLRTGDVGSFGSDGRLHVVDRLDDMIITGGVNVSPSEVEAALIQHPQVFDACAVGIPDDEWGQRVVVHVIPRDPDDPPTLEALRDFGRQRLAPAKLPRQVVIVNAIPRSPEGKLLYRRAREMAAQKSSVCL